MDIQQFETRKRDHLRHAMDPAHQARGQSGLESVHLYHDALPELDFDEIRLDSVCLGRPARTPFYIAGMTAGHPDAPQLNRLLARACEARGWAMGVGSQRRQLTEADSRDLWRDIRAEVPKLELFANIGIAQLGEATIPQLRGLVESIRAQALVIHLNALQECMQPEGTLRFRGALARLEQVCAELGAPVVLKETGCGFSPPALAKLGNARLAAIDISGLGGTHWGRIEGARAGETDPVRAAASKTFASWGESTVDSVIDARRILPKTELWASGGVRSGLAAAKLIALGAHRVGYAQPALEAALQGEEELLRWMELQEFELKTALFCTGAASPQDLREKQGAWKRNGS